MKNKCAILFMGNEPSKAHTSDAGHDLRSFVDVTIKPRAFMVVPTGTKVKIPDGFYGQLFPRSGLAAKGCIAVPGVIDSGYTGEIKVTLTNVSDNWVEIAQGDKIVQMVILPVPKFEMEKVNEFPVTDRGANGFGSTGR